MHGPPFLASTSPTTSLVTPKLAVVLLELLTPQTILRQVIAGRTVLWEVSKPPTRRMTMLRVLTRAGPTCLRHTVPVSARTGAGLQEGKHRSIRPCAGPKVHTGTALPSGNSWSRVGWRWRVKPPNAVTVAGGYAIAVLSVNVNVYIHARAGLLPQLSLVRPLCSERLLFYTRSVSVIILLVL